MAFSIPIAAAICFLSVFAFVFAIGAEMRRSTGQVVPDVYDDRTYCRYDSDASTVYGLSAFGLLLVSQVVVNGVTRCLCFGKGLTYGSPRCFVVSSFFVSWVSFLAAEVCLLAGSARNAYHTKYLGYYQQRDLTSCANLRKGVFAAAAALVLVSMVASLLFYWAYAKADTGGWQKHQNEGVGMTNHSSQKDEFSTVRV